ncbi:hypothetical protein E2C01_035438 [Portunus trituberculatus]|uniref:Secreted protein n=1 Tax=Portunus trituberculatus TaxID=210409 RepID=A0A5B7F366_PORTR|nr:hypothetical protein [Portunus trituberculatus]
MHAAHGFLVLLPCSLYCTSRSTIVKNASVLSPHSHQKARVTCPPIISFGSQTHRLFINMLLFCYQASVDLEDFVISR